ncbi:peptidase M14 [Pigmentiphaga aceris]|uniref:Peptidase M14 n=1 Tax=Pigmentiphaga aceris TaxID=1940612 RepID=A0A5C0B3K7_9BURK|nr:succinylglutamate desuccinylase/aspartoacylase family protein [Pigmentiphaga aceris]QEI08875.1 peptidase M14 [Pigmentiphaga aceris]
MRVLLDRSFPRSLDALVTNFSAPAYAGAQLQAWLFEGVEARRAAEATLAAHGVKATIRSAYKPLLHAFLEEIDHAGLTAVTVQYPRHDHAIPTRFLLESYPLQSMFADIAWTVVPGPVEHEDRALRYQLDLHYADGRIEKRDVLAPNVRCVDHVGQAQISPAGWVCVSNCADEADIDQAWPTEAEGVFEAVVQAVQTHSWGNEEPFFERMDIRVDMPGMEFMLGYGQEQVSTFEAMHEDLYFALLEVFQQHSARPVGNRGMQPGQIVPDIRRHDGDARVRVEVGSYPAFESMPVDPAVSGDAEAFAAGRDPFEKQDAPLSEMRIAEAMTRIRGEQFSAHSRQGRVVQAVYRKGSGPSVLISAAQHANETSGPVGILRAAQQLDAREDAHFTLIALENPDGYAMHQRLIKTHPHHMHHAARYSALGDDLAYREKAPWFETGARRDAVAMTGAELHINLHGYPSHEWTRPWSGYLPRKFEMWTIPKGFFLVLRHQPGLAEKSRRLVEGVTLRLAEMPGLVEFNARQVAAFEAHAGAHGFEIINGIPCLISESATEPTPISLITEFPDETIYGDAFVFAHTAQMLTVTAAVDVYRSL